MGGGGGGGGEQGKKQEKDSVVQLLEAEVSMHNIHTVIFRHYYVLFKVLIET